MLCSINFSSTSETAILSTVTSDFLKQIIILKSFNSLIQIDLVLVGCFGFNGPLRQYFSLYRAASQREGERGEKNIAESKNVQTTPHQHLLQAQTTLALLSSKL